MKQVLWLSVSLLLVVGTAVGYYLAEDHYSKGESNAATFNVVLSVFLVMVVSVIYTVIRDNRDPRSTMAWIQVLLFLPLAGFVLYLLFGVNYRKKRMFALKAKEDEERLKQLLENSDPSRHVELKELNHTQQKLASLVKANSLAPVTRNNRISLFHSGKAGMEEIFKHLKKARKHIHIEMFAITGDDTGWRLSEILREKAAEGVRVRVMYDDVGSIYQGRRWGDDLRAAGVEILPFFPVHLRFFASRVNYRNHRRIIVIDGEIGMTGGINISNKYVNKVPHFGFWRDTWAIVQGDAVHWLQRHFVHDWSFANHRVPDSDDLFPPHSINNYLPVQTLVSGPDGEWASIQQLYFAMLSSAHKRIWISTPYLVLSEDMLAAVKVAALSGLDVRIIVPGRPDHRIVFFGTRSYYEELLASGIKIYEYSKGFIHAKLVTIDGHTTSMGTANMDIRSFSLNFEINSIVYDEAFTAEIEKQFEIDFADSEELQLSTFVKRSAWQKRAESLFRLLSPLL